MSHETRIVKIEQLGNGQWVIGIQCCGNPTVYPHTVEAVVMADAKKKLDSISDARLRAVQQHETQMQAEQGAIEIAGEKVKHE